MTWLRGAALVLLLVLTPARAAEPQISTTTLPIGGPFALTATDGTRITEHSFPGRWLLIYFGYTACPDACPTALNTLGVTLGQLGAAADRVQPIFITLDPDHDTQAVLANYVGNFDRRLIGLAGTPDEIAAVAKEFRVYYRVQTLGNGEYTIDHSSYFYVVNPAGQVVELLTGDLPGHRVADELRHLIQ